MSCEVVEMSPKNEDFARLLRESGWNQTEASKRLRLSRGTVNKYANGKEIPSERVLLLFSELIGSSVVLTGSTYSDRKALIDSPTTKFLAEGWEHDLLKVARTLDKAGRKHLFDTAKLLSERNKQTLPPGVMTN